MILQPIFVVQFQSYSTKGQVYMCSIDFSLHFDKILEFCRGFVLITNRLTLKYARPTPCQQSNASASCSPISVDYTAGHQ